MTARTLRWAMREASILCIVLAAGCGGVPATAVRLDVTYDDAWGLDGLTVAASGQSLDAPLAHHVRMELPDGWAGQPINVVVWGNKGGQHFAGGNVTVTPILKQEISAQVTLSRVPCGAWCTAGATECQGNNTVVCTQDDRGCSDWTSPTACASATPYCSLGVCVAACVDECATGEQRCDGPGALRVCGKSSADTCLVWLPPSPCAPSEICSNGSCGTTCQDECKAGAVECLGQGTSSCGDLNHDRCLEWGPIVPCSSGTSCSNGSCSSSCKDECTASECNGELLQTCGQFDLDPCKDLSPGTSCVPSDPCMVGMCSTSGCQVAPKSCATPPASTCKDSSTLTVYDAAGTCSSGTCGYAAHDMACPNCPNCDTCAGVVCNTPPAASCISPTTLRSYSAPGTCSGTGTCSYPHVDMTCSCANGSCAKAGWSTLAPMPTARYYLAAATGLDGRIYALGGDSSTSTSGSSPHNKVEAYNPSTNTWVTVAPMPTARSDFGAATGTDGRIYAIGGYDGNNRLGTVETYDPRTNVWATVAPMPTARSGIGVALGPDGRIYAIGGFDGTSHLNTVEAYDPKTNVWATGAPLSAARSECGVALGTDGHLYSIGGYDGSNDLSTVGAYRSTTNAWTLVAPMPTARSALGAAAGTDGRIYAIGGIAGLDSNFNTVEAYTPSSNTWATVASMPTAREALAAVLGPDGRIYAIGGDNGSASAYHPLNTVEVYTP